MLVTNKPDEFEHNRFKFRILHNFLVHLEGSSMIYLKFIKKMERCQHATIRFWKHLDPSGYCPKSPGTMVQKQLVHHATHFNVKK